MNKSDLIEIYGPIKKELLQVEKRLHALLSRDTDKFVAEIGNYILKKPGKRLRPALVLLSGKISSSIKPKMIDLAAAIELIHTATLVHDDIIDGAETRRNQKSVNVKFGRDAAILFGDFLYSKAFEVIASLNSVPIIMLLLKNAGTICRGEIEQLHKPQNSVMTVNDYLKVIEGKTASLFATCCEAGAILSGQKDASVSNLEQYGYNLGMGFQIIDDCLDMIGDEKHVGKSVKIDAKTGKSTLPIIYIRQNPKRSNFEAVQYSKEIAVKYCDKGISDLNGFKNSAAKNSLIKLSDFVLAQVS